MKNILLIIILAVIFSCTSNNENTSNQKQIDNISAVEDSKTPKKLNLKGKITTLVDGTDVGRVNLWDTADEFRIMNGFLTNGDEVIILEDNGPYYLVESVEFKNRKGYCMKDFVETD